MNLKDDIFKKDIFKDQPFKFNKKVTEVFEDTLERSIPGYSEVMRMSLELAAKHFREKKSAVKKNKAPLLVYDLGCSTGYFIKKLIIHLVLAREFSDYPFQFVGVDGSAPMIAKAKVKCFNLIEQNLLQLKKNDLLEVEFEPESMDLVTLNYTLQFLSEDNKKDFLTRIYQGMKPGGMLIMSEKIRVSNSKLNQLFIDMYHDFKKRNDYSEEEIERKQKSLEGMLFPQTIDEHLDNFKKVGFKKIEIFHKWYNFTSFVLVK